MDKTGTAPALAPPIAVMLVGATAVGKSALALELATRFPLDIVSADSRQVYRYMDIGTAKPSPEERARVRHYLIDLVTPDDVFSAQRFQVEGDKVLKRLGAAGRMALVVGGTGFYLRALLDGDVWPDVPPDADLRERLRIDMERMGAAALHDRLAQRDPASAARIHPNNVPRVIRALEIVEVLGGPVPPPGTKPVPTRVLRLGLRTDRAHLQARADQRVREQVNAGLVEETRLLLAMGYSPSVPAMRGFGYSQMVAYLEERTTLADAVRAYQEATRQYIRRQETWFRADSRITWVTAGAGAVTTAAQHIERFLDRTLP